MIDESRKQKRNLKFIFLAIVIAIIAQLIFKAKVDSLLTLIGAILIILMALIPFYLWIIKNKNSLPIFPLFAIIFIFKYAFPLVSDHPIITLYSPGSKLFAGFTVAFFLFFCTVAWFSFIKRKVRIPKRYLSLQGLMAINTFLIVLFLVLIIRMNQVGHWFYLGGAVHRFLDLVCVGIAVLGVFFLAYRWGTNELKKQKIVFFILTGLIILSQVMSFYLISSIIMTVAMIVGFFLGSKKIPIMLVILLVTLGSILHAGKSEMRSRYWSQKMFYSIQPWEYGSILSEWFAASLDNLRIKKDDLDSNKKSQSIQERGSMAQLLLLVQEKSPEQVPYFHGATYAHIFESMMPRFLNPNKITPLIGGRMLSLRYGLLTEDRLETTSIAWDMLIESYANFGLVGCVLLGLIVGSFFGYIERWSSCMPVTSFRFLYAAVILLFGFMSSEMALNTYIVSLMHTSFGLVLLALFLMKVHKIKPIQVMP